MPVNEEVIRRLVDADARGDTAELRGLLAAGASYHRPGGSPMTGRTWAGSRHRPRGIGRRRTSLTTPTGSPRWVVSVTMSSWCCSPRGADGTAATLRWRSANLHQTHDGQVVDCRVFLQDRYGVDAFSAGMPTGAER